MTTQALVDHTQTQCAKELIKLAPKIWGAVGFAASNVYVIEGESSLSIIDTTESTQAAENILEAIHSVTAKPIARIIYTHSHRDHISGASVFVGQNNIPVIAHAAFSSDLVGVGDQSTQPYLALAKRTQAQFGIGLSPAERISIGCGPGDRPMKGLGAGFIAPNQLIEEETSIDLDGIEGQLIFAPGETADHMVLWLPEQRILFCGDNWYHAFPNLYAIRGTAYRDYAAWSHSLNKLLALAPNVLAPGHHRPVFGTEEVALKLQTTREAIDFIIKETSRMMNEGWSYDDIAEKIRLPEHLADLPWLGEFYGKVGWSARAFAVGTLGWYDGNPTHLTALDSTERATQMAQLAGGVDSLKQVALSTDNLSWRLELLDHLIQLGEPVHGVKADTLCLLAEREINATARNSYFFEAKRLREQVNE